MRHQMTSRVLTGQLLSVILLQWTVVSSGHKINSISKFYDDYRHRSRCNDVKVLDVNDADVIFTGTIRDISADWDHPGQQNAKVEIKRIMKGVHRLDKFLSASVEEVQKRVVVVHGIGDPLICNSDARKFDSRIFLVNVHQHESLHLNSSLLRLTLSNIEHVEATLRGKALSASSHPLQHRTRRSNT